MAERIYITYRTHLDSQTIQFIQRIKRSPSPTEGTHQVGPYYTRAPEAEDAGIPHTPSFEHKISGMFSGRWYSIQYSANRSRYFGERKLQSFSSKLSKLVFLCSAYTILNLVKFGSEKNCDSHTGISFLQGNATGVAIWQGSLLGKHRCRPTGDHAPPLKQEICYFLAK